MQPLKLIVGLGNPSPQYDATRHNVGALWVRELAERYGINLASEAKFKGEIGRGLVGGIDLRLLVPSTYMNLSGESVGAVCRFYKFDVADVLVAYDEMAFDPGVVRLKQGGGDNGHNGIRSVRSGCGNDAGFNRLRIGVGHPIDRNLVTAYLTQHTMPAQERQLVEQATRLSDELMSDITHGEWQKAMNALHASAKPEQSGED
jgi:PTH1 family peptidyl-tRNA hydrolase